MSKTRRKVSDQEIINHRIPDQRLRKVTVWAKDGGKKLFPVQVTICRRPSKRQLEALGGMIRQMLGREAA